MLHIPSNFKWPTMARRFPHPLVSVTWILARITATFSITYTIEMIAFMNGNEGLFAIHERAASASLPFTQRDNRSWNLQWVTRAHIPMWNAFFTASCKSRRRWQTGSSAKKHPNQYSYSVFPWHSSIVFFIEFTL